MKTIGKIIAVMVLSMLTVVLYAQQEDKGLGKGQINNNQGNQNDSGKSEKKGGVDIDKNQQQSQNSEKKGNVNPNNEQNSEKKGNIEPNNQQNTEKKGQQQDKQQGQNGNQSEKSEVDKAVKDQEKNKVEKKEELNENNPNKEQNAHKDGQQNGNAYGKDKEGMTGKEFGQLRSEESKTKVNTKLDEAVSELDGEFEKLNKMKKDINDSKARNEEKYKNKQITKEQYDANKVKISEAESIVNQTEDKLLMEKESLKNAKLEIK